MKGAAAIIAFVLATSLSGCGDHSGSEGATNATPAVSRVSPNEGLSGTVVSLTGTGLAGATQVFLEPTNSVTTPSFSVIDDRSLQVTIPDRDVDDPLQQAFVIRAGDSATLVMPEDAIQVTAKHQFDAGTNYFVVRRGGVLTGGGGHALVYVEAGGIFNDTAAGTRVAVVEANGTFNTTNGGEVDGTDKGEVRVYSETGANITSTGTGVQGTILLAHVTLSTVPEVFTYTH